jgi:anaerobic selenocysteine-containing dehydrogenase
VADLDQEIRTTCPRDCYDACGVVVLPRPGRPPLVRGDKADPVSRGKLCRKCSAAYNGVLLDSNARLSRPLRRIGPKGDGGFEAISWEEATGEIADRLGAIVAEHGGASVLNAHYSGTLAMIGYHFPMRFFNRLGATEVDPDTVCNKAGHAALRYVYGSSLEGFDPRTAADSASIVVWGANPSASAPHQHEHWLSEAGCPVVVVDPLRTETAKQADLHLQPRPGTDAVLAYGFLYVLWRDGLVDRRFVYAQTVGFDELETEIARVDLRRVAEITRVPAAKIERAAHWYGAGPSLLWIGQGLQRQATGGNVVRAVAMLPAVTGSLGKPGGGFLYLNGYETRGLDADYLLGTSLAAGPPPISQMDLAAALEDPGRFRGLFCWNINIAASSPEQRRLKAAMRRHDLFTVVVDLFQTDTADLADVVLPAASFLEHDDLVASYFHHSLGAQVKAVDPPGEALPNSEIFRRLARRMGYEEPELYESDDEVLARLLADAGAGLGFGELAARGTLWPEGRPRLQFEDGRYPTPSGRIEIVSERAQADGFSRIPLPEADDPPTPGHLRLLSPASSWTLNDSYGNDPIARSHAGAQAVILNPSDAAARRLRNGDMAILRSAAGELRAPVSTTPDVPVSVAVVHKGHWPKLEPSGTNVNILNPGQKSDMAESSAVHGIEVTVERAPDQPAGGRN